MPERTLRHSLAAAAPILCAIHCVATPVLVAVLPAFAMGEAAERSLFAVSALLATWAMISGVRVHRDVRPVAVVALGLIAWAVQLVGILPHAPSEGTIAVAALLVAVALIWNARLRHLAEDRACACAACGHPDAG